MESTIRSCYAYLTRHFFFLRRIDNSFHTFKEKIYISVVHMPLIAPYPESNQNATLIVPINIT